eukprot:3920911-Rhodomonas_salina.2
MLLPPDGDEARSRGHAALYPVNCPESGVKTELQPLHLPCAVCSLGNRKTTNVFISQLSACGSPCLELACMSRMCSSPGISSRIGRRLHGLSSIRDLLWAHHPGARSGSELRPFNWAVK